MITQKQLKEQLHYNPETGVFTWLISKGRLCRAGNIAGCKKKSGYIDIVLSGKSYKAHRLAWLYVNGHYPLMDIDHINGVKSDNRIVNVRDVEHIENMRNKPKYKNNKSGFIGISRHKKLNKWQAEISINGKTKYIGVFSELGDAVKARVEAEEKCSFHINHGR